MNKITIILMSIFITNTFSAFAPDSSEDPTCRAMFVLNDEQYAVWKALHTTNRSSDEYEKQEVLRGLYGSCESLACCLYLKANEAENCGEVYREQVSENYKAYTSQYGTYGIDPFALAFIEKHLGLTKKKTFNELRTATNGNDDNMRGSQTVVTSTRSAPIVEAVINIQPPVLEQQSLLARLYQVLLNYFKGCDHNLAQEQKIRTILADYFCSYEAQQQSTFTDVHNTWQTQHTLIPVCC